MEEIAEHFGSGMLALIGTGFMLVIVFVCIKNGGVIHESALNFMQSICG